MITRNSITFSEVSLVEAKAFVRVDTDAHDALLTMLIGAAHEECFGRTHCVFGEAEFTLTRWDQVYSIQLPYGPILDVEEVLLDDVAAVLDTDYTFTDGYLNLLVPYTTKVECTYTVGMALTDDVKHAILQRVKYGFDYGDDLPQHQLPRFFDRVVDRHRYPQSFVQ